MSIREAQQRGSGKANGLGEPFLVDSGKLPSAGMGRAPSNPGMTNLRQAEETIRGVTPTVPVASNSATPIIERTSNDQKPRGIVLSTFKEGDQLALRAVRGYAVIGRPEESSEEGVISYHTDKQSAYVDCNSINFDGSDGKVEDQQLWVAGDGRHFLPPTLAPIAQVTPEQVKALFDKTYGHLSESERAAVDKMIAQLTKGNIRR